MSRMDDRGQHNRLAKRQRRYRSPALPRRTPGESLAGTDAELAVAPLSDDEPDRAVLDRVRAALFAL